jgi:hypothetical protein
VTTPTPTELKSTAELQEAVAAFEQVLELMPDDVPTIEALVQSCSLLQDEDRLRDYVVRLATMHVRQERWADARALAPKLRDLAPISDEAAALLEEIDLQHAEPAPTAAPAPVPKPAAAADGAPAEDSPRIRQQVLQGELALAWQLHDRQWITSDEYAQLIQELTDLSSRAETGSTVSLLHVLAAREYARMDHLLASIALDAHLPLIPLSRFDTPPATAALLSPVFVRTMGAAPFDRIGIETLVAVLNPYNDRLRADVSVRIGHRCHFYLASAVEFDRWTDRCAPLH